MLLYSLFFTGIAPNIWRHRYLWWRCLVDVKVCVREQPPSRSVHGVSIPFFHKGLGTCICRPCFLQMTMDIYKGSSWVILVWVVVRLYGLHRRCSKQPSTNRDLEFIRCEQTSRSCYQVGWHFVLLNLRFAGLGYSCSFEVKVQELPYCLARLFQQVGFYDYLYSLI